MAHTCAHNLTEVTWRREHTTRTQRQSHASECATSKVSSSFFYPVFLTLAEKEAEQAPIGTQVDQQQPEEVVVDPADYHSDEDRRRGDDDGDEGEIGGEYPEDGDLDEDEREECMFRLSLPCV